jgi:hypothetical protein
MSRVVLRVWLFVCLLAVPSASFAQGAIAGQVAVTNGATPGVVVEVSGPALIERSRQVTTGTDGRFRIDGLRPGVYDVTFSAAGFRTVKHEGVRVVSGGTAAVSPQLAPGPATALITLPAAVAPLDARASTRRTVLDASTLAALPLVGSYNSLLTIVPGIETDEPNVVVDPALTLFAIRGGRPTEGRLAVDGFTVGASPFGNTPGFYFTDPRHAEEVVLVTSGALGEAETGGLRIDIVPRQGGRTHRGRVFAGGSSERMLRTNLDDELRAFGVSPVPPLTRSWVVAADISGPLMRDRLWYVLNGQAQSSMRRLSSFFNAAAGNPALFLSHPDLTRRAYSDRTWENLALRLTWLASARNTVGLLFDGQSICRACSGASTELGDPDLSSPEATGVGDVEPLRLIQASWSAPWNDRLLLDAGASSHVFGWGNSQRDDSTRGLARIVEGTQFYRSQDWAENESSSTSWRASASLMVGRHVLEVGHQGQLLADDRTFFSNDQNVTFRFVNGLPTSLLQVISPFAQSVRAEQLSAYVQEQWTAGRLTLHGALRYDRAKSWFPAQRIGPTRFLGNVIEFPKTDGVDAYRDLTPRFGAAYDLSGDGTTVLRVSGGRFLEGVSTTGIYAEANPVAHVIRSASRGWSDVDRDNVPDCDLRNPFGSGECGQLTNILFGGVVETFVVDPALLGGSGVRPSDWNVGASIERLFAGGMAVEAAYHRRWFDGFTVRDILTIAPSNARQFSVVAPTSPDLPNGGGYSVGPFYSFVSVPGGQSWLTSSDRYGSQTLSVDAIDVTVHGRTAFGLTVAGGSNTMQRRSNTCDVHAAVPENAPLNPFCDLSTGWLTQVRGLATYDVPVVGVQVGAIHWNRPGPTLTANTTASTNVGIFTVPILEPGALYGDRVSSTDLRVNKAFRVGGSRRVGVGLDIYNVFNGASPLSYSAGSTFFSSSEGKYPLNIRPTSILSARLFRITGEFSF